MVRKTTISKTLDFLRDVKNSEYNNIHTYCMANKICDNNKYKRIKELLNSDEYPKECKKDIEEIKRLVESLKYNKDKKEEIDNTTNSITTEIVRDEFGVICGYRYNIPRKKGGNLLGTLSREDMERLCNLYSVYGANLTAANVHIEFPQFSLAEFQRIRNAFLVYKYTCPFAPHIIEEHSDEELVEMSTTRRTNNLVRNIERDQLKDIKEAAKKLSKENLKLKERDHVLDQLRKDIPNIDFIGSTNFITSCNKEDKHLIIWLSDMHIGAYNDDFGFYQIPEYNSDDIQKRLNKIVQHFAGKEYEKIHVMNLGDSVDSYNKETTRGGHPLPSVMNNKEMSETYITLMLKFFTDLKANIKCNSIGYFCIGESNHDGDWGWINNKLLAAKLETMGVISYVSDYPIDYYVLGDHNFVLCHGKDNNSQFKNFPLTLNDKTELYFSNWMRDNNCFGKYNYVVKGDLHRYAYTVGQSFDYISVGSLYGSSNWITANFGNTKWSINFMEIQGDNMQIGTIR